MTLDEAIKHAEKKEAELIEQAEQLRDIGEALSNPKQPYNEPVKACRDCAEEHRQLAEWLKELKQLRNQTSWIPVSERLPNICGVYNVTKRVIDGGRCYYIANSCYFDGTGTWHDDNRINFGREHVNCIIAWQPLPEPYKEVENENGTA